MKLYNSKNSNKESYQFDILQKKKSKFFSQEKKFKFRFYYI